jgi:hypothetical protein
MILVGYPGIGRSTLVENQEQCSFRNHYIDLEKENFIETPGRRIISDADKVSLFTKYVDTAISLHKQGNVVMVSSSYMVRKILKRKVTEYRSTLNNTDVVYCFPHINMKNEWLVRLKRQHFYYKNDRTGKAYKRAEICYINDIYSMSTDVLELKFPYIIINNMDYNLNYEIDRLTM